MKPATKEACSKRVFSGARWDMRGHMCGFAATVQEEGKWYCKRHAPSAETAKREKWEADFEAKQKAYDAERIAQKEASRRAKAYPRLVEALRGTVKAADAFVAENPTVGEAECITVTRAILRELGEIK